MSRLPAWTHALLKLIVPRTRLDDVVGDLEETGGGVRDALATAGAFLLYRLRARWWAIARWLTFSDLTFGVRLIRKEPVLSATAVVALATAVTVACMGYTFAEQMLYASLPFPNGDQFVRVEVQTPPRGDELDAAALFRTLRTSATTLQHVGAVAMASGEMSLLLESGEVASVRTTYITPDTVRFLPYSPLVGRFFVAADGAVNAPPVVIIHERLWERRFGRTPSVVGQTIMMGGVSRTIVGVAPQRFEFPFGGEAWVPMDVTRLGDAGNDVTGQRFIAILRDGVDRRAAQAELETLMPTVTTPGASERAHVRVQPFATDADDTAILFPIVLSIILLTLLVVVGNVAVLMTARGWARATELAVRAALGAGRARIVGQLTAEMLLLGLVASALGVLAAVAALGWIDRAYPDIPFWIVLAPGTSTLAFVALLALIIVVVAGVWPALVVTRGDLARTLHHGGRGASARGFGRTAGTMITVQVALAVALLSGAVSMARGFLAYVEGPPQVAADELLTARVNLPAGSSFERLTERVVSAMAAMPGVSGAGVASHVPRYDPPLMPVEIDADAGTTLTRTVRAPGVAAGSGFVEAIGGRAVIGRLFTAHDSAPGSLPVAIVNESFVARYFHGRNPLGRRLLTGHPRADTAPVWRDIVGVVPDLGLSTGDPEAGAGFYVPYIAGAEFMLVVRTTIHPEQLSEPLRAAVAAVDPAIRLRDIVPLEQVGADEKAFLAGMASTMIALGIAALALSIVSVYALLSFAVTRRTREIGVRVALGATRGQIVASILGSAGSYLALGALIGTGLGVLLMEARSLLVFRMPTSGILVVPAVIVPLLLAGLIACWVPARRALAIEPAAALKVD